MNTADKTCTIIGMRPHQFPSRAGQNYAKQLLRTLERRLREEIAQGIYIFQTGMNIGVDIWCGELICELREEFPHIRLHCVLPCETQANHWPEVWREQYFDLLAKADEVTCLQNSYSKGCSFRRSCTMLSASARLIVVHNNIADRGIAHVIGYASKKSIDMSVIPVGKTGRYPAVSGNVITLKRYNSSQISSVYPAGSSSSKGTSAARRA